MVLTVLRYKIKYRHRYQNVSIKSRKRDGIFILTILRALWANGVYGLLAHGVATEPFVQNKIVLFLIKKEDVKGGEVY